MFMILTPKLESTVFYVDGKLRNAKRGAVEQLSPDDLNPVLVSSQLWNYMPVMPKYKNYLKSYLKMTYKGFWNKLHISLLLGDYTLIFLFWSI